MSVLRISRPAPDVLWAEIHRPEAHNAIDFKVMDELENVCETLETDGTVKVFVLSGNGYKYFASGGDLKSFSKIITAEDAAEMSRKMGGILSRIESAPCWTIACINGDVFGGGCETILAFDLRIAVKHARFGFTQGRFRLTPGWGGLTRLVEHVGKSKALLWLGTRSLIDSETALVSGLIDAVTVSDNLQEHILQIAAKLGENERDVIVALKKGAADATAFPRSESIEKERAAFAKLWEHQGHHKKVEEFLNRKGM